MVEWKPNFIDRESVKYTSGIVLSDGRISYLRWSIYLCCGRVHRIYVEEIDHADSSQG